MLMIMYRWLDIEYWCLRDVVSVIKEVECDIVEMQVYPPSANKCSQKGKVTRPSTSSHISDVYSKLLQGVPLSIVLEHGRRH